MRSRSPGRPPRRPNRSARPPAPGPAQGQPQPQLAKPQLHRSAAPRGATAPCDLIHVCELTGRVCEACRHSCGLEQGSSCATGAGAGCCSAPATRPGRARGAAHGAEDLLAPDAHGRRDARQHGGRVELAAARRLHQPPARHHLPAQPAAGRLPARQAAGRHAAMRLPSPPCAAASQLAGVERILVRRSVRRWHAGRPATSRGHNSLEPGAKPRAPAAPRS